MRGVRTHPHEMHEYQRKRLTRLAFCKRLIPKNMFSATGIARGTGKRKGGRKPLAVQRITWHSPKRIVARGYKCQARFWKPIAMAVAKTERTIRHGCARLVIFHAGATSGSRRQPSGHRIRAGP